MINEQTVSKPESARTTGDEAGSRAPSCSRLPLDSVICGDNCEVMRQWPDQCVDLVVTSPPYDDLRTYGGHSWDFYGVAWLLKRVLKPGGVIVWVVGDATKDGSETGTSMRQALHFQSLGLRIHDTMIYTKNCPPQESTRYEQKWEYMLVVSKGKPAAINLLREPSLCAGMKQSPHAHKSANGELVKRTTPKTADTKNRGNIWHYNNNHPEIPGHPAPFPIGLASEHIQSWSNPGDIVLDPFAGSGTTLKAAKELNRRFIGIEINPEYAAICKDRISQDVLQLFSPQNANCGGAAAHDSETTTDGNGGCPS